jgi:hypothetical protein
VTPASSGKTPETDMKRKEQNWNTPQYDYRSAVQAAGPMLRLSQERTPYFTETRRWHPAVVSAALLRFNISR